MRCAYFTWLFLFRPAHVMISSGVSFYREWSDEVNRLDEQYARVAAQLHEIEWKQSELQCRLFTRLLPFIVVILVIILGIWMEHTHYMITSPPTELCDYASSEEFKYPASLIMQDFWLSSRRFYIVPPMNNSSDITTWLEDRDYNDHMYDYYLLQPDCIVQIIPSDRVCCG